MAKKYVIGLDLGTTSSKAVVFDLNGKVTAESERLLTTYFPEPGWVEQDPAEIMEASIQAVKEAVQLSGVRGSELAGIGISCAMHSLICADAEGKPLTKAMIWSDARSGEQADRLKREGGYEAFRRTGTPIHPMSPFVKMHWMRETSFEPFSQAAYFFSVKDYLLYQWFGLRVIDYGMASASGLFNGDTLCWDEDLLKFIGVKKEQLSTPVPPTELLTGITPKAAEMMGIPAELPFAVGSADGQLANLGVGAIEPGEVVVTVGTSGAVRQWMTGFRTDPLLETFCYRFSGDESIVGGPTNNGGIALQWLKELFNHQGTYEDFISEAEKSPIGADGLIFLPYVNGERAPLWNQNARGSFIGMSIAHQKHHFIRAVLEGISLNLYQIGQSLDRLAGSAEKLYVNGGLARSPLWTQMVADIFGKPVYLPESHHSAAWGAAWVMLVSAGLADSFESIKKNIPMKGIIMPDEERHGRYMAVYDRFSLLAKGLPQP